MKITLNRAISALVAAIFCISLTGCAAGTQDDPTPVYDVTSHDGYPLWETFKLPDGRKVGCLMFTRGGSCDWANAEED